MPTGVALRDVREQLFSAAERVLVRAGAQALTSRAVTLEAGVAKGVLHRHFPDFDQFLTELILDRITQTERQAAVLLSEVGHGTVAGNVTAVLRQIFNSVAVGIVSLVIFRDDLRARLFAARGRRGLALLTEAGEMIADYLRAERDLGRLAPGSDVDTLAPMLIASGHLLFADQDGEPLPDQAVEKMVAAALTGVMPG
ncbi:TetR/AcrR family transcriptional regulator [Paractinoplanes ferrugineus]|uniref:TetR family transcriptional regulator n=1 Tax=Paractinoplanes ferrugineus TaxID=113564 RepID=A0A919J1U7_9ACTN|nr:TetR/AcrR family transcriptional regulator [Actinoplanes ferrugineus]GIE12383.1 TetR family transcriptional regulator [Actinoplanes ferrugineus]